MKVELISYSNLGEKVCGIASKTCVSKNIPDTNDNVMKSLRSAISSGHEAVLEHWSATFAVSGVSRALTHQLVRHRVASYCVSGDTKIRTSSQKTNGKTIRELYELPSQYFSNLKLRCVDESNGNIRYRIECRGENHTIAEWSRISGIKGATICKRIKHGWSNEDAIFGELRINQFR